MTPLTVLIVAGILGGIVLALFVGAWVLAFVMAVFSMPFVLIQVRDTLDVINGKLDHLHAQTPEDIEAPFHIKHMRQMVEAIYTKSLPPAGTA